MATRQRPPIVVEATVIEGDWLAFVTELKQLGGDIGLHRGIAGLVVAAHVGLVDELRLVHRQPCGTRDADSSRSAVRLV